MFCECGARYAVYRMYVLRFHVIFTNVFYLRADKLVLRGGSRPSSGGSRPNCRRTANLTTHPCDFVKGVPLRTANEHGVTAALRQISNALLYTLVRPKPVLRSSSHGSSTRQASCPGNFRARLSEGRSKPSFHRHLPNYQLPSIRRTRKRRTRAKRDPYPNFRNVTSVLGSPPYNDILSNEWRPTSDLRLRRSRRCSGRGVNLCVHVL